MAYNSGDDRLNNYSAIMPPTATDDETLGYDVGSLWVNVAQGRAHTCVDRTTGAAVWTEVASGFQKYAVRNETGSTILAGRLVAVTGYSVGNAIPLVAPADKDDPDLRPAYAALEVDLPNNASGEAIGRGLLVGVDTSAWAPNDILVLGGAGAFIRPWPETDPFTGEEDGVGQVVYPHATNGIISVTCPQQLLAGRSRCRARRAVNQTIANESLTKLQFDAEDIDTDGMHDPVTNNTRVTIPSTGDWLLVGNVRFAAQQAGNRAAYIIVNGIQETRNIYRACSNPDETTIPTITRIRRLTTGDYVELAVFQDSGSNLDVVGSLDTTLEVVRIR